MQQETYALFLAYRDPRVPWFARVWAACVVAYALSPIDLIPDFVPLLGYLDDLILIPLGIALALRMIPPEVMVDSRAKAREALNRDRPMSRIAAAVIVVIWLLVLGVTILLLSRAIGR